MKTITAPRGVDDLYGLHADLRREGFLVVNVAADQRGTYVYLDDGEEKDPAPVVERWIGRPAPEVTRELLERRMKEWKAIEAEEARRREEQERSQAHVPHARGDEPVSWIRRIFRKK
jgi:hypothetical protein